MSDQCALDESGGLKEAEEIEFFFSESETTPLASSATLSEQNPGNSGKSRLSYLIICVILMKLCLRASTWSAKEEHREDVCLYRC
jgi:hypothetical protein